ncbi:thymidine kinase [Encephalitozoon cuniculi EcunIII-L]|uniref:Thymidine kinase n=1 Tax=Encephalitozoon cuniculi TaxID=6035 RepID=M1KA59_ENCCN|nr:thymidine kinase [Encephalitozoon cuniculi]KMV66727.1 thymidine kinase [Encephalitozoon cuniculi EcunIII-L]
MTRGTLNFVTSPMNAGKTANMLLRARHAATLGRRVLLAKPLSDTRHESSVIRSRCGIEMKCDLCAGPEFSFTKDVLYGDVDILLVDEAQFLSTRQIDELREVADVHGIPVWCYGLLTDFKKNLFEGSKRLVELCDKMIELDIVCYFCKADGRFHLKYANGKAVVEGPSIDISIPGDGKFVAVCHMCWTEKTSASEEVQDPRVLCAKVIPVDR